MEQAITKSGTEGLSNSGGDKLIASPWHLLLTICFLGIHAYWGTIWAAQSRAGLGPSRTFLYLRIIFLELVTLGIAAAGVRMRGVSLEAVFGKRWKSASEFLRDLGLGVCLLLLTMVLLSVIGGHGHGSSPEQNVGYLLPEGSVEMALWIAVSISAGICEEAVYRGYLQRQFGALTGNAWVGIVLAAAAFGAVHIYQGVQRASVIAVAAILTGWFAHWRKTVRPGMFAHALQDGIAPVLMRMMRR